jgi:hypothetical protein
VLLIPKPGRKIPKSVEKQSGNDRQFVVNSFALGSLRVIERVARAVQGRQPFVYDKAGSFIAVSFDGLAASIFLSTPRVFGVVATGSDPDRRWMPTLPRR